MLTSTQRTLIRENEAHGPIIFDYDPSTGSIFMEFERLELDDTVLTNYRVTISTEHVLAWTESLLTNIGKRCKRIVNGEGSTKRLRVMLKLTENDQSLIYTASHGAYMVLIRQGCVVKVPFVIESMDSFLIRLKETDHKGIPRDETTASLLAAYVHGLMTPS